MGSLIIFIDHIHLIHISWNRKLMLKKEIMINCFCGIVDRRKTFIFSMERYQRFSLAQISESPTCYVQDLKLHRIWIWALLNEIVQTTTKARRHWKAWVGGREQLTLKTFKIKTITTTWYIPSLKNPPELCYWAIIF